MKLNLNKLKTPTSSAPLGNSKKLRPSRQSKSGSDRLAQTNAKKPESLSPTASSLQDSLPKHDDLWTRRADDMSPWEEIGADFVGVNHTFPPLKMEVNMRDLLRTAKKKDGDFEFVPKIRPVIVLDDRVKQDFEAEEPWEHVTVDEERTRGVPSYAQVLGLSDAR